MESTTPAPGKLYRSAFSNPEVQAKAQAARQLTIERRREALERQERSEGEQPLPADLQGQLVREGANMVLDKELGIRERAQALNAVAKLTERHDTGENNATSELIEFLRRIPR